MTINLLAAWISFLLGGLAGAASGLFFRGEDWLGGYGSWRRRMTRLGHISFFGIGLLNLSFALSARALGLEEGLALPSALLVVGAVTMPLVCYLSAWKEGFAHAFVVPAGSVIVALGLFVGRLVFR